jgi:hypothetical protein
MLQIYSNKSPHPPPNLPLEGEGMEFGQFNNHDTLPAAVVPHQKGGCVAIRISLVDSQNLLNVAQDFSLVKTL